jgi:uroporphyrinogen decarboxylase
MNSVTRIQSILNGKPADRVGFWLGYPHEDTREKYCRELAIALPDAIDKDTMSIEDQRSLQEEWDRVDVDLAVELGSDLFWCNPESAWRHPEGKPMIDAHPEGMQKVLTPPGVFAETTDVQEILDFDWPDPQYLDFTLIMKQIEYARSKGMAVIGGMWMPFFHYMCDYFGMEQYFIKMYTDPEVVHAATNKILDFCIAASTKFLNSAADRIDAGFFGNDFGSQLDLLISPENFDEYVLPGFKRIIDHLKSYDRNVILHSCGAIDKVIPRLIEAGTDALHPLQAKAANMDAEHLAEQYKGQIAFIGAVDTQDLLPFHTAQEVTDDVNRLKDVLGERFIVSPSHEALLPNVPLENVLAMRDTAIN